ncbi:hypothetical protein [Kitasatospora viridis]|uniref:Uncharacterized protein n=1 Tax=Kitasatospora viridis TaxID=281105 RepID=A0A561UP36_9ACTN|nr:hypothetical protein [Kitasatospora viridis]TWG01110.1 hypothetical protein FHX73_114997 [Kitasatospora viridis]
MTPQEPPTDGHPPQTHQHATASGSGQVYQAGRDLIVKRVLLNAPSVLVLVLALVWYLTVYQPGRTPSPAAAPAPGTAAGSLPSSSASQSSQPIRVALGYDRNHVDNFSSSMPNCSHWVFNRPLSSLLAPTDDAVDETWARQAGGIDLSATNLNLIVQSAPGMAGVSVNGVHVIIVGRVKPVTGTMIQGGSCGASGSPRYFTVALASDQHTLTPVAGTPLPGVTVPPAAFPFKVSPTDIETFQIRATPDAGASDTVGCNCLIRWKLAVDWFYEGTFGTWLVDDNGQPFQTQSGGSMSYWQDQEGQWKEI